MPLVLVAVSLPLFLFELIQHADLAVGGQERLAPLVDLADSLAPFGFELVVLGGQELLVAPTFDEPLDIKLAGSGGLAASGEQFTTPPIQFALALADDRIVFQCVGQSETALVALVLAHTEQGLQSKREVAHGFSRRPFVIPGKGGQAPFA